MCAPCVLQREELLAPGAHAPEEEGEHGVLHEEMFHSCAAGQPSGGCVLADLRCTQAVFLGWGSTEGAIQTRA